MPIENRKITRKSDTKANLTANLSNGQDGIETDGSKLRIYKDASGTLHEHANIGEGATFTSMQLTSNLDIGEYIRLYGDLTTLIDFRAGRQTFQCTGVQFLDIYKTTQDIFNVNPLGVDIDFIIGSAAAPMLFLRGSDGMAGINTLTPIEFLTVNGSFSAAYDSIISASYAVATGAYVPINVREGVAAMVSGYQYRVRLDVTDTANSTGAIYIVTQATSGPTWTAHLVSANDNTSNHPLLRVNGTTLEIYHNHPSSTYLIRAFVQASYSGNTEITAPTYYGLEGAMTNFGGKIGVGVTPFCPLHVKGAGVSTYGNLCIEDATIQSIHFRKGPAVGAGDINGFITQDATTLTIQNFAAGSYGRIELNPQGGGVVIGDYSVTAGKIFDVVGDAIIRGTSGRSLTIQGLGGGESYNPVLVLRSYYDYLNNTSIGTIKFDAIRHSDTTQQTFASIDGDLLAQTGNGDGKIYFSVASNGVLGSVLAIQKDVITAHQNIGLDSGKGLLVNSIQVIGAQGATVANATDAASVITQLNLLLARCRAHGIIAT